MTDQGVTARIGRLEVEIDALEEEAERCLTFMRWARYFILGGALALAAMPLGLLRAEGPALVLAISAVLFGIIAFGSNRSTAEQTRAAIAAKRAERNALIDALAPRTVKPHERAAPPALNGGG